MFIGPIRDEHIQRVLYYAKHVRYLHYKDVDFGPHAQGLTTSTLMRVDKLGAFVPLRKIHLHGPLRNAMLLPLTSPNLAVVQISTKKSLSESTEICIASFLQSLTQYPYLRHFAIEGPFRDITIQLLPDFTNLHCLSMHLQKFDIPINFLKRFASSMPSLRHLQVSIADSCFPPPNDRPNGLGQPHPVFRPSFPSLRSLTVECSPTHLEKLLGVLDAPLLKSVKLEVHHFTPEVGALVPKFFEMNQILKEKVDRLRICDETTFGQSRSFSFVQSLGKLKDLSLCSLDGAISMSDIVDTFSYNGSWLRSLTSLRLINASPRDPVKGISIAALSLIAEACPNLKWLFISIHHPEKPEKNAVAKDAKGRKPHDLEGLMFINLPVDWDDSMSLAIEFVSLLVHLFPATNLPHYIGINDKPDAQATREVWWKGVEDMWRMYQTIRDKQNVKKPLPA